MYLQSFFVVLLFLILLQLESCSQDRISARNGVEKLHKKSSLRRKNQFDDEIDDGSTYFENDDGFEDDDNEDGYFDPYNDDEEDMLNINVAGSLSTNGMTAAARTAELAKWEGIKKAQIDRAVEHEGFFSELEQSRDGFDSVATYFGKTAVLR